MIQVWIETITQETGEPSTRLAHFGADGVIRFAVIDGEYTADEARAALVKSDDIRAGILPRQDAKIIWHDDDQATIAEFYKGQVDEVQGAFLQNVVTRNQHRITVYQLKQRELIIMELGVAHVFGTPILDAESGGDPTKRAALAQEWGQKGQAWLTAVAASEAAAKATKGLIAKASSAEEMVQLVAAFSTSLKQGLNG